jgi:hypothetical protein
MRITARLLVLALSAIIAGPALPLPGAAAPVANACVYTTAGSGPIVARCTSPFAAGPKFNYGLVAVSGSDWIVPACNKRDTCKLASKKKGSKPFGSIKAPAGGCPCHPHVFVDRGFGYVLGRP